MLLQVPGVVEASVVGVPHPRLGEAPRAYLVTEGTKPTDEVIMKIKIHNTKTTVFIGYLSYLYKSLLYLRVSCYSLVFPNILDENKYSY